MRHILSLLGIFALGACSGGGGSGSSGPPPIATLNVTLSPGSQTVKPSEDASETTLTFDALQSGTTSDPVFADVQYDHAVLVLQGNLVPGSGKYTATFKTAKDLGGNTYKGNVTFRLCRDAACGTVYPGSTQTFAYTVEVQLKDWEALQRNAAHTGYVHATFEPADFKKAWEWVPANTIDVSGVATQGATTFVSRTNSDRTHSVYALASASGTERWGYNLGTTNSISAPSIAGDQLFVSSMVMSSSNNQNVVLNATSGQYVRSMLFAAQWSTFAPPTPYAGGLYQASGYYGNVVYAYDTVTGATRWTANGKGGNIWDGETPAVDDKYVYYYSGASLDVFDRTTGALFKSMADPFFAWGGYSYYGGPILGSRGNVLAYSGSFFSANGGAAKPLVNYALASGTYSWRTADVYATMPALAKGVVYVARNDPMRLDAISEETGGVLWSWTPPAGERFLGNAIATDTLLFVSTDTNVYAVSLTGATHASVWSAATPGELAISGDSRLIVTSRGATSAKLTAYNLRAS